MQTCPVCRKNFIPLIYYGSTGHRLRKQKFCSQRCFRSTQIATKSCPICRKTYSRPKSQIGETCSKSCSWKLRWQKIRNGEMPQSKYANYPKVCTKCGEQIPEQKKHGGRGMCLRCYRKSPDQIAKHRETVQKYRQKHKEELKWKHPVERICQNCSHSFTSYGYRKQKFCSRQCVRLYFGPIFSKKYSKKIPIRCWTCNKIFLKTPSLKTHYCSPRCTTNRWAISFPYCVQCHLKETPHEARGHCKLCYKKTIWHKTKQKNKFHKRRARRRKNGASDITSEWLIELKNKTCYCPIDGRRLTERGYPAGRHLDHIIPFVVGGTHTMGNTWIICGKCNVHRPTKKDKVLEDIQKILPKILADFKRRGTLFDYGGVEKLALQPD